jgi:hypothetical protein
LKPRPLLIVLRVADLVAAPDVNDARRKAHSSSLSKRAEGNLKGISPFRVHGTVKVKMKSLKGHKTGLLPNRAKQLPQLAG